MRRRAIRVVEDGAQEIRQAPILLFMVVNCVMLTGGARIPMLVWYQHLVFTLL
jgi:hypothetical protein